LWLIARASDSAPVWSAIPERRKIEFISYSTQDDARQAVRGISRIVRMAETNDTPPIFPNHIEEMIRSIRRLHAEHHGKATRQQRALGRIFAMLRHPLSPTVLAIIIAGWIGANLLTVALGHRALDEPPFQWLQGAMTLASLFIVVSILGAQKHDDELDDHLATLTLELAILNEQKIAKAIQLLEELRRDSPQILDRVDQEAESMAQPSDPRSVLDAIKGPREGAPASVKTTP
jgi:uncharacterized membrane protein